MAVDTYSKVLDGPESCAKRCIDEPKCNYHFLTVVAKYPFLLLPTIFSTSLVRLCTVLLSSIPNSVYPTLH